MPIEIRELHIRMNVNAGTGDQRGGDRATADETGGPDPDERRAADDELVTRCVEQVMNLLRNRAER